MKRLGGGVGNVAPEPADLEARWQMRYSCVGSRRVPARHITQSEGE